MSGHDIPEAAPNTAYLFDIIRTTRSMRRLKPDPVPNELIRKILEAGVCAPSGGNMQRWRFLVIHDPKIKETVGALYKRAWDEQVAPRYRSGEPAPGTAGSGLRECLPPLNISPITFMRPRSGSSRAWKVRRDPHIRLVRLPGGSEHAARGESARSRHDPDDAVLAIRERSRGRAQLAFRRPLLRPAADRVSDGPVRASPPRPPRRCRI
jgi:nitroreductase